MILNPAKAGFFVGEKVYSLFRRVCIREAFPLEGEGGFSGAGRKKTRMRVCFHQAKQLNRSFACAHTPHPSATPPPSPQVGKAFAIYRKFSIHIHVLGFFVGEKGRTYAISLRVLQLFAYTILTDLSNNW